MLEKISLSAVEIVFFKLNFYKFEAKTKSLKNQSAIDSN